MKREYKERVRATKPFVPALVDVGEHIINVDTAYIRKTYVAVNDYGYPVPGHVSPPEAL